MNLYLITGNVDGYDTYSDAVVSAPDEDTARLMHPGGAKTWSSSARCWVYPDSDRAPFNSGDWDSDPSGVSVELLGTSVSDRSRVICASFHAG
jgi:hypothetical protein